MNRGGLWQTLTAGEWREVCGGAEGTGGLKEKEKSELGGEVAAGAGGKDRRRGREEAGVMRWMEGGGGRGAEGAAAS